MARETLSRKLTQLEEEKVIENIGSKTIRLLDVKRLTELSVVVD
ncbi:MAG: helix-turn-helix domain-containing protein [Sphaerochaeta sp.]